ncbi:MAG: DUF1858 domain-containing protein [bacterium]|jgi:hybrid cluster-associated redox disulfide protein
MASDDVEDRARTDRARTTLKRAPAGNGPVCPTMLIQDVLLRYPETWKVFVAHQLPCPRCMASTYESISQLASMLGVDLAVLLADLNASVTAVSPDDGLWPVGSVPGKN